MNLSQTEMLARIDRAFEGVVLGTGVSMRESEVLDAYGSGDERATARSNDERTDWRHVDDSELRLYFGSGNCGLCFLDAEGMRYYLPACMASAVRSDFNDRSGMVDSLLYILAQGSYFVSLSGEQRACVGNFLTYLKSTAAAGDYNEYARFLDDWTRQHSGPGA